MKGKLATRRSAFLLATLAGLAAVALVWSGGCGNQTVSGSGQPDTGSPPIRPITRNDPDGVVAGFVFKEPVPLAEALALGAEVGGDVLAVYRTDLAYVRPINLSAQPTDVEPVASRFAYVDADGIRERRLAAVQSGDAPPITGLHTSQTYWEHWEDQWRQAQEPGVRFEAVAIYVREEAPDSFSDDARFRAVVIVPHRRTDSQSPDYLGELLLESEEFPSGVLNEPEPPGSS